MKIGVALPSFASEGYRLPPGYLQNYAQKAESYEFSGVWMTEHLVRPPSYNSSRHDPIATIGVTVGATKSIEIGTSILILPMRNPVLAAKQAATLQHLSGNRFTLGVGIGWYEKEYSSVNVPFEERGSRFTEALELLNRLFSDTNVTFEGEYYSVEDFTLEPQLQQPPRILIAGGSKVIDGRRRVLKSVKRRILKFGDGWIGAARSPSVLLETWAEIEDYLIEHGRDPNSLTKVALNWCHMVPNASSQAARRHQRKVYGDSVSAERGVEFAMEHNLSGSVDDILHQVSKYNDRGFDQLIVGPMVHDRVEVDKQLEVWRDELLPAFQN